MAGDLQWKEELNVCRSDTVLSGEHLLDRHTDTRHRHSSSEQLKDTGCGQECPRGGKVGTEQPGRVISNPLHTGNDSQGLPGNSARILKRGGVDFRILTLLVGIMVALQMVGGRERTN